jgi:hypothetical protein
MDATADNMDRDDFLAGLELPSHCILSEPA